MPPIAKIVPHLWFTDRAEEAASFNISLVPDSRINSVTPIGFGERPLGGFLVSAIGREPRGFWGLGPLYRSGYARF